MGAVASAADLSKVYNNLAVNTYQLAVSVDPHRGRDKDLLARVAGYYRDAVALDPTRPETPA